MRNIEDMDELVYRDDDCWSNCCEALVYAESDICSDCGEHCEVIDGDDLGEYNNDTNLKFKYQ